MKDLIDNALELTNAATVERGHTVSTSIADSLYASADPIQCSIVIANVIENAAIYTPANGHISITAEGDGSNVFIRVADNGIGIAHEDIDAVFKLFKQGKRPLARSVGGLGLIADARPKTRRVARWTLVAHSDGIGRGSEFTLTLRPRGFSKSPHPKASESCRQQPRRCRF